MDMAFLNPQDCFTNPLTKHPFISPHMKKLKHHPKSPPPNRRKIRPDQNSNNIIKQNSPHPSRAVVNKVNTKTLVMGQVKILKRGKEISVKTAPFKAVEATVKPDLGSTKLLGPDPESVPTQIRLSNESVKSITNVNLVAAGFYAGSAFNVNSPPPSSLPLPAFFTKKLGEVKKAVAVDEDDVASSFLKRVLRLDL